MTGAPATPSLATGSMFRGHALHVHTTLCPQYLCTVFQSIFEYPLVELQTSSDLDGKGAVFVHSPDLLLS